MSDTAHELLAVYVDGETKTGKGAAGKAIAEALQQAGYKVYYDVAGDFYRRYVALVRRELQLDEEAALPTGPALEKAASKLYGDGSVFTYRGDLGDLQRPAISQSVSVFGELALAQQAGRDWWAMTARQARAAGAEVIVVDGRNPRSRMATQAAKTGILPRTALDLYLTCEPAEAARRVLLGRGIQNPAAKEIEAEAALVMKRREQDRTRTEEPFIVPTVYETYVPSEGRVEAMLNRALEPHGDAALPVTITLDNTDLTKSEMLAAVIELATAAVSELEG